MEFGSGTCKPIERFHETPNSKFIFVRVGYHDTDWDTTILICLKCRFNDGEKLTNEYFEISCINKDQYEKMRQTNMCSYWERLTNL